MVVASHESIWEVFPSCIMKEFLEDWYCFFPKCLLEIPSQVTGPVIFFVRRLLITNYVKIDEYFDILFLPESILVICMFQGIFIKFIDIKLLIILL